MRFEMYRAGFFERSLTCWRIADAAQELATLQEMLVRSVFRALLCSGVRQIELEASEALMGVKRSFEGRGFVLTLRSLCRFPFVTAQQDLITTKTCRSVLLR